MKHLLENLGFSEKETLAYITLLKTGPLAASVLARLSKIKRTSIYDVLNSLEQRGVVGHFQQGAIQYFYPDDVNKLVLQEKARVENAKKLAKAVSQLKAPSELLITYYKGQEGIKNLYSDVLDTDPQELLGWLSLEDFYKQIDPLFEEEWTQKRITRGIQARIIVQKDRSGEKLKAIDAVSKREVRFCPPEHPFTTSCFLYEPFIVLLSPTQEVLGLRIQNKDLFTMQKAIFEMNWTSLPS